MRMDQAERDAYWESQVRELKRAGALTQSLPPHQGYRQKLDHWKAGDVTFNAGCDDDKRWVHVDITMRGEFRHSWFSRLERRREDLEREISRELGVGPDDLGYEWLWEPREGHGESWIILRRGNVSLSDPASRREAQEWVARAAVAFRRNFSPLLDTL